MGRPNFKERFHRDFILISSRFHPKRLVVECWGVESAFEKIDFQTIHLYTPQLDTQRTSNYCQVISSGFQRDFSAISSLGLRQKTETD